MTKDFDLIVIGGGSGGLGSARRAAALGKKVALIEGKKLGGTCVNVGCVPKKVMWYAAQIMGSIHDAKDFGITGADAHLDWPKLVAARNGYVKRLTDYWGETVEDAGIALFEGHARFIDSHTVEVNKQQLHAKDIIIATGGEPIVPPVPGAELGLTSDGFFALQELPRRIAIIGGGYIGVELTGMLHDLGADTTIVALENRLLEVFDELVTTGVEANMRAQGIKIETSFAVGALQQENDGISLVSKTGAKLSGFDHVIWAVGRKPNSASLNLSAAGIETDKRGFIVTDELQNTSVPGIYAIGDITGRTPLTPVAIAAGRALINRLYDQSGAKKVDYTNIPSVIFAHPPVGFIGLSEAQAVKETQGKAVTIYTTDFTPMRHTFDKAGGHECYMKLVCLGEDEKIVGIHIVGEGADEMLQGFAVAVKMGARKADFDAVMPIHPTSAEELVTIREVARRYPA